LQMVDPSKCVVQGEVFIRSAHSSQITAIHMESIGTGKHFLPNCSSQVCVALF
jgi:hypothetical protein